MVYSLMKVKVVKYNALPGVMAQDVTTWGEMKQVVRELKDPEVKEQFATIVVDTVDIAAQLCEKYICSQLGVENIGDGGWTTNGWSKVKREWENVFRAISMEGYALIFISHDKDKKFTREDGTEFNKIVPSCTNTYNEIIKNMVDIEAYIDIRNGERVLVLRSPDDSVECKSRFAQIAAEIPFSYDNLVDALNKAINAEAEMTGKKFITNEKVKVTEEPVYDYDALMAEFQKVVTELMEKDKAGNGPKITDIVNKVLGRGKKFTEATPDQVDLMNLVVSELKALNK